MITDASYALARAVRAQDPPQWWYISASHLHMTCNRLGLLNAEEVYHGRLMARAADHVAVTRPQLWHRLWNQRQAAEATWRSCLVGRDCPMTCVRSLNGDVILNSTHDDTIDTAHWVDPIRPCSPRAPPRRGLPQPSRPDLDPHLVTRLT